MIKNCVHILFLCFTCCAALGTLPKLSESHLSNGLISGVLVHVLQWVLREEEFHVALPAFDFVL